MPPRIPSRPGAAPTPLGAALRTFAVALAATAALGAGVALLAPEGARALVAWSLGVAAVLLAAALAAVVYQQRLARHHRARVGELRAEAERLADVTMPALVEQLRGGASVQTALDRTELPRAGAHLRILRTLAEEVGRGERMRAAAMSACANAAGRVQALATGMLADLREMEHRHGEEVLGDLLKLDHTTAQAGRLADSIAVLTGARSGRRWNKPIAMESILRGAMGRISAYRRIHLHSSSEVAIAGHAAEGIMHALAEIMDNAASFSPPSSPVHVYVEEAQAGVVVSVEDSGLVMGEAALQRAQETVSADTLDLMSLSGTRLGLAVVGCLARKHGLNVSFRPSARGGTGVVVLIPQQLVTEARPPARQPEHPPIAAGAEAAPRPTVPAPRRTPEAGPEHRPEPPEAAPAPLPRRTRAEAPQPEAPAPEFGESGLPKRRRGQTLATASPNAAQERGGAARPARSHEESAARFRAFRQAVQGQAAQDGADRPRTSAAPVTPPAPSPARPEDDTR
ncbi:ATP-binding protein [Streptomyces sp. NPDC057743]|uniref:ATP-binding protein n=1 Tax=Streptomyces sp. NPDC057743 TaxID=3346236 RepID=UPI0036D0C41B